MIYKNIKEFLTFLLLFSFTCYGQENNVLEKSETIITHGIKLGNVIAIVISWSRNKSILYAILHGTFGWAYIIYFIISRENEEKNI